MLAGVAQIELKATTVVGRSDHMLVDDDPKMYLWGLAFALFGLLLWTAFDAWSGSARQTLPSPWGRRAAGLIGLVYLQVLLGALVAGNDAGLVYNDWPLMNGRLAPDDYWGGDLWSTLAHVQGAVQLHHRLVAYVLTVVAVAFPGRLGLGDVAFAGALQLTLGWFGTGTAVTGLAAGLLLALPPALMLARRRGAQGPALLPLGPALLGGWLLAVAAALCTA